MIELYLEKEDEGMLKLAVFLKDYKKECIIGPFFKFMEAIFELLLPTLMALTINQGVDRRDGAFVVKMGVVMAVMAVCGYGCALICQYCGSVASQGFGTLLRNAVFGRILKFSAAQVDSFGAPTLTNRITNDVNQLQNWVAMLIRLVVRAPFICIGSIIMSFFLDVRLALILLCSAPVLGVIIYLITKNASPLYRQYQRQLDRVADSLRENLTGVRVIRAFSKTGRETERFSKENDALMKTGLSIGRVSALFNPLTSVTVNFAVIFLLWAGAVRIQIGDLSQGQIIAFINYVSQILYALTVVSNLIILLTKSMASAVRVNEILDTVPELSDGAGVAEPSPDAAAVSFRAVSFGYNRTGEKALEDISLEIRKGETVGVIGGTGSGKSTLTSLIYRACDVSSGAVLVGGVDVRDYSLAALREKIGVVPQKALLFTGTVAENIRWGRENADDAAVKKAARTAQAEEFIEELPWGYETPIDRGGVNLSGGQRQRLTIARALLKEPEVLILDDASSALDFLTDARLRRAIRENSREMTVLIVSQRVGVVKNTDRIVVLDDGRIVGLGSHDELMRSCETYREICLSQLSEEEAEA